jgi:dolichol-phosphate mannosyltransferase
MHNSQEPARPTLPVHKSADVTVALPVFNEEKNLGRLFERIDQVLRQESLVYRIVAVDDGSTDGTAAVLAAYAARLPIEVVQHAQNRGLGIAIRSGLLEAIRQSPADGVIVTMDADESHSPALIKRMLDAVELGADVVIASRFQPGSEVVGVPLYRRMLSDAASLVFRVLFPTKGVLDFTSGYRAYRVSSLDRAIAIYGDSMFEFDGFQCMVDLLLKLRAVGCKFAEVPAVLRYDLKEGGSKMRVGRTIVRTLELVIRRRLGF